jgi:hypothetical protein
MNEQDGKFLPALHPVFFPLLALFFAQPTNHIGSAMESLQC